MTDRKTAIITGASSGIGKSLALRFAAQGYAVVINGRNEERLHALEAELKERNIPVLVVVADVSDEAACRNLIEQCVAAFGRIDVLINNAGMTMRALFGEVELSVLKKVFETNFWSAVYCTNYALPYLLKSQGSLVGISSIAGKKGLPARSGYSASKFAMEGFLQSVRIENMHKGLHVLVACPGFTATAIRNNALNSKGEIQGESPLEEDKLMSAEEVALRIYVAVSKRKRDLVLTSTGKLTVMLNKILPAITDQLVYKHFANENDSPLH